MASKCISPSAYRQTRLFTASKCISNLARSRPPSATLDSLNHGLQVWLLTLLNSTLMWISKLALSRPGSVWITSLYHHFQALPVMLSALPDLLLLLPDLSSALPNLSSMLPIMYPASKSALRLVVGAARYSPGYHQITYGHLDLSPVLPDPPEGPCITAVHLGIWPPWDCGPTSCRHCQRLAETKIHFAEVLFQNYQLYESGVVYGHFSRCSFSKVHSRWVIYSSLQLVANTGAMVAESM